MERLLSNSLQWQRDRRICVRMSVLTEGQAGVEDQSLGLVEEETMTDVYRVPYCQGLSVQCYQSLIIELEASHPREGKLFLIPRPKLPPSGTLPVL